MSRKTRRVIPAVAVITAALGLSTAAPSLASNAYVSSGVLHIEATAGETNVLTVRRAADEGSNQVIYVHDADGNTAGPNQSTTPDPILILSGPGCAATGTTHELKCTASSFSGITANLGDKDDYFSANVAGSLALPPVTADGSDGADYIVGGGAADALTGGAGDDELFGNGGNDTLSPGAGTDDDISGGAGTDTVTYADRTTALNITLDNVANDAAPGERDNVETDVENVTGGSGNDTITGSSAANVLNGGAGDDVLNGAGGADTINAGDGNDTVNGNDGDDAGLNGEGGNDTIVGGLGADKIDGGAGTDTASYAEKTDPVFAQIGSGKSGTNCEPQTNAACEGDTVTTVESVIGGSGNDHLVGDGNANTLDGRGGNDSLDGMGGNDVLLGSSGNDVLQGGAGSDEVHGGDGFDRVSYRSSTNPVTVTLDGQPGDGESGENDNLFGDLESVEGGSGNDTLIGSDGLNELYGLGGDDTLDGRGGPDKLDGGAGKDTVSYASATSGVSVTLDNVADDGPAGEGDNVLDTVEVLVGSAHDDTLVGSASANDISGGAGNDVLDGGLGADVLSGGDGSDTVVYDRAAGSNVKVDLDELANDGAAGENDNVKPDVENLTGGAEDDSFLGSAAANVLNGGGGDDSLDGAQGNDVLLGGAGNDSIDGGAGDDRLQPGTGADEVMGGAGSDTVDYSERSGAVSVSFDDQANDGEAGEGDNVHSNVESAATPGSAQAAAASDAPASSASATPASAAAAPKSSSSTARSADAASAAALTASAPRTLRAGKVSRFSVTGKVAKKVKAGKVTVLIMRGSKVVATKTVTLRKDGTFSAPMRLRASKGKLTIQVRYGSSAVSRLLKVL